MLDEFESRLNAALKMAAMSDARHLLIHKGGMARPKTGATNFHAKLGLPSKSRAIIKLSVCGCSLF